MLHVKCNSCNMGMRDLPDMYHIMGNSHKTKHSQFSRLLAIREQFLADLLVIA